MMDLLKAIGSSVSLYADATALGKEVVAELNDPAVRAEVNADPRLKSEVDLLSSDWRTVENDEVAVHKSSFFSFWGRATALMSAAKTLQADVASVQHDPAIALSLATKPLTLAALSRLSAAYTRVAADLKGFA